MPVFGKSLFETVLQGMDEPEPEEAEETSDWARFSPRGFQSGFVGLDVETVATPSSAPSDLYDDYAPDPRPKEIPAWIDRLSEAEVAEDLALANLRLESDIRDLRRAFALLNHPDRVDPEFRDAATRRMMIANQLIDAALVRYSRA
jgi:hypothetical protein